MSEDPLVNLPLERWSELENGFKSDVPRGISGYTVLKTQKELINNGVDYGFKVYCPFGDVRNGFIAFALDKNKEISYEIIIQCPVDRIDKLEAALRSTKLVNWQKPMAIPFIQYHVIDCLQRALGDQIRIDVTPSELLIFSKPVELEHVKLPPELRFGIITPEYLDLVDSTWPLRHDGSRWFFQLLIDMNFGYGLFDGNELISWVFVNEYGALRHMFTMEKHRRKGYGELVLMYICHVSYCKGKPVIALCFKNNPNAYKLYKKLGFSLLFPVARCYLYKK